MGFAVGAAVGIAVGAAVGTLVGGSVSLQYSHDALQVSVTPLILHLDFVFLATHLQLLV